MKSAGRFGALDSRVQRVSSRHTHWRQAVTCYMVGILADCLSDDPDALCRACTLSELGEGWQDIMNRTGRGIPKGKYYRDQAEAKERQMLAARGRARGSSRYE